MTAALPHRRSRRWIGFFAVLAVLGAAAMIVPLAYNLSIQLKPRQLADARRRWREHGPPNYDLVYLVNTKHGEQKEERAYLVQVRGGRVVVVVDSGDVVYLDPSLAVAAGPGVLAVSSEDPRRYGVPALFDQIEAGLRQDEATKARSFATAQFDATDGHPYHYRRGLGTKERVEWNVKMTRISSTNRPVRQSTNRPGTLAVKSVKRRNDASAREIGGYSKIHLPIKRRGQDGN